MGLEKAEEPEIKLPTSAGSQKKQENSRKISTSGMPKPLIMWITTNHGKFLKGKGRREVNWELWVNTYILLYTRQITKKYLYIAQGTIYNI